MFCGDDICPFWLTFCCINLLFDLNMTIYLVRGRNVVIYCIYIYIYIMVSRILQYVIVSILYSQVVSCSLEIKFCNKYGFLFGTQILVSFSPLTANFSDFADNQIGLEITYCMFTRRCWICGNWWIEFSVKIYNPLIKVCLLSLGPIKCTLMPLFL